MFPPIIVITHKTFYKAHPRHLLSPTFSPDAFPFGQNSSDPPLSASKSDPTNFGPNCVGCITTQNVANGAITHTKIAPHSVDQTQLTFAIHNGTNGAQGPQGIPGATPTFYDIPYGHDGWNENPGSDNLVISGSDLTAININSSILIGFTGGAAFPAMCGAYNIFANGFAMHCNGAGGEIGATLRVVVFNHL